jgi:uncharacterized protein (TIRG00374 family)
VRRWLVILASLAIVLTLVRAAGFRHVAETWGAVAPRGIVLSVACYYAALVVRVLVWRLLLGRGAPPLPALGPPLALGFVLGHVTPAKSGEPATSVLVSRAFGIPLPRTLSVLTAERAAQLLALLATFVPAAAWSAGGALAVGGAVRAAAAVLGVLLVGVLLALPALRRLREPLSRLPRIGAAAAEYVDGLIALAADRRRLLPLAALSAVFWLLQYLSLWAILRAGGADVNLSGAATVAGAAILGGTLTMLPLGTQDGISAVVLAGLGVPAATGFSLALFHTLLSLACGLVLVAALPFVMRGR